MKTKSHPQRKKAIALILVLAFLVLISGLIVAFLTSMSGEQSSTRSYASEMQCRQMADSATQMVIAQITLGTASTEANGTTKLAWASQPGMIRTYDDAGYKNNVYKLYSSANMVESGALFTGTNDLPAYSVWGPGGTSPGLYTDINQPALASDTAGQIIPDSNTQKTYVAEYPIVDPAAVGNVEGFQISSSPVCGYSNAYPPAANYNPLANPNPAPMPVAWLYVLQNGQVIAPTGVTNGIVTFDPSAPISSSTNPIVGRIAFWTDDETCKLNINTASEGTCFDVPRGTIQNELSMGLAQPVQSEFQRTPGHPAMTCLSPALGWIQNLGRSGGTNNANLSGTFTSTTYPVAEAYYDITPRINYLSASGFDTTTQGGGVETTQAGQAGFNNSSTPVQTDGDRLYANLDELVFHSGSTSATARISNPQPQPAASYTAPVITKQAIEQTRFFLTASSRAPETTLFNTPRISVWPLQVDGTASYSNGGYNYSGEDAKDALIKFCSTLGSTSGTSNLFCFQRYNEGVTSNTTMLAWGGGTTPHTSLPSGVPSAMSTTADMYAISRNQQVYQYLQNLTSQNIPGYGGSFGAQTGSKWSPLGRDQVVTEIFDWIRSDLDQFSSGLSGGYQYSYYSKNDACATSMVAPITINTGSSPFLANGYTGGGPTKGFGNCPTIVEAALVFFATSATNAMVSGSSTPPNYAPTYPPLATTQMQAMLVLLPFNPTFSLIMASPICLYDVSFNNGFKITCSGVPVQFTDGVTRLSAPTGTSAAEAWGWMPFVGIGTSLTYSNVLVGSSAANHPFWKMTNGSNPNVDTNYPFVTGQLPVPLVTDSNGNSVVPTFTFGGGNLTIRLRSGIGGVTPNQANVTSAGLNSAGNEIYQTINMNFPGFTAPVPQAIWTTPQVVTSTTNPITSAVTSSTSGGTNAFPSWDARMQAMTGNLGLRGAFFDGDIVRAVEVDPNGPSKGDFRLIAGSTSVPASYFHPHPEYQTASGTIVPINAYTSSRLDQLNSDLVDWATYPPNIGYPIGSNNLDSSSTNANQLVAARYGRFGNSMRVNHLDPYGFVDSDAGYGEGNGSKGYTGTQIGNNFANPGGGITTYQSIASTAAGSGATAIGVPNPGGLVAGITHTVINMSIPNSQLGTLAVDTPNVAHGMTAALTSGSFPGDWDNAMGAVPDGPYINTADSSVITSATTDNNGHGSYEGSYWSIGSTIPGGSSNSGYVPNRQIASPVMFGSLPTPSTTGTLQPWQTLLFCANPASGFNHPGWGNPATAPATNTPPAPPFNTPPDYALLDLFTMPIVEPYAISEPLSTAGKVNLNYQIMPFTYVRRDTAVRGVLKSIEMGAFGNKLTNGSSSATVTAYKFANTNDMFVNKTAQTRFTLNLSETNGTLYGFENKFNSGDIFRSAGEICSIFLVPNDPTEPNGGLSNPSYSSMSDITNGWWSYYKLTGDNMRESPYNQIYPRVTTKSNSFTVHYKVEVLKKSPPSSVTPANGWNEALETVAAVYRGSTEIERYVDPSDPSLPDFIQTAGPGNPTLTGTNCNLDRFYKFRVVSMRRFNP